MDLFTSAATLTLLKLFIGALFHTSVEAWELKGKWSTAGFDCQGAFVEISVDMNSRIGGGDASPVRPAYMVIEGKNLDSVWIVGASMNTVITNNRNHELILGNSNMYLDSHNQKRRTCVAR